MNLDLLSFAILAALPADAAPAGGAISVPTALCLVLGAALLILARAHVGLRGRLEELERRLAPSATSADSAPPPGGPAPSPATPVAPPAPAPVAAPAAPALNSGIPAAHLAVIAAAVHHAFRGRARLASVLRAPAAHAPAHGAVDWAREGRRDIFISHRVR